ncbi:Phosphoglycolate phosphatase [uncultured archaeon]|nr:Phosphoglycolate phosphatase [uncultured archaeon]
MFISFGLNGTLVDSLSLKKIWNEELPSFYSKKNSVDLEEAKKIVFSQYYTARFVEGDIESSWDNLDYWLERLGLASFKKDIETNSQKFFRIYPEVKDALQLLKEKNSLILMTGVNPELIELELRSTGLVNVFDQVFSSQEISNSAKQPRTFTKLLEILDCSTDELFHVGSNYERDYLFPSSVGIVSYLMDRGNHYKEHNEFKVINLNDFIEKTRLA